MKLKELFEKAGNKALTYDELEALMKENKLNFADLSEGGYVSKHKYEDELAAKVKEIETLSSTLGSRDADLTDLRKQLQDAEDGYIKVQELSAAIQDLQGRYDEDTKAYKEQLSKQAYEFAVKDFASELEFSSQAAKRDFIQSMLNAELKMGKDGKILGMNDFKKDYEKENKDAFVTKQTTPDSESTSAKTQPQFVSSTPGTAASKPMSLTDMMIAANNT